MNAIELLLSDSRGVYIPQHFVEGFSVIDWHVSEENALVLLAGPDHEEYWDVWNDVLDSASYTDQRGNVYTLHQDGDLWAVCPDIMSNEEHVNFFGEMKPAPNDAYEYSVCANCLIALANDDYSGMDDDEAKAVENGLTVLHKQYSQVIPDGAEYGFSHERCECCDALAGDRYRVLCFDKKEKD